MDYDKAVRILSNYGLEKTHGPYTHVQIAKAILSAYESGKRDAQEQVGLANGSRWCHCKNSICKSCGGKIWNTSGD